MIHTTTTHLLDEAARVHLRFACEDCAHHVEERQRCSLGYPNEVHRREAPTETGKFVFCKEFELF